jgi:hypothetical protein
MNVSTLKKLRKNMPNNAKREINITHAKHYTIDKKVADIYNCSLIICQGLKIVWSSGTKA